MSYYKHQDWKGICDVCGFEFKASKLRKRWDGLMVCKEDWEMRHPSDFFRVRAEDPSVPWSRTEPTDNEIGPAINTDTQTSVPTGTFDGSL